MLLNFGNPSQFALQWSRHTSQKTSGNPVTLVVQLPRYQCEALNSELSVSEGSQVILHLQNGVGENAVDVSRGHLCISLGLLVCVLNLTQEKEYFLFVTFKCSCYDVERIQLPPTPATKH